MINLVATDKTRLSHSLKHDYAPESGYTREVVTYTGAAKTFAIGDLVKANGAAPANAGEIYGVVMEDKSAALNVATKVLVGARGPQIWSKAGIQLGGLVAADVYAALAAKGILVSDAA